MRRSIRQREDAAIDRREAVVIRNGCPPGYALSELIGPRPIRQTLVAIFVAATAAAELVLPETLYRWRQQYEASSL